MSDYLFRTEDIKPEEVTKFFVETKEDRKVINLLKNRNATILVGSRGVGKSFLLRVAQQELLTNYETNKVFPVYISFVKSSLINTSDENQFKHWMLSKISTGIVRSLRRAGLLVSYSHAASLISGSDASELKTKTKVELVAQQYEDSWKNPGTDVDSSAVLDVDDLKEAIEDLATELSIDRFVLLIDEAAHIFSEKHQRQFFTLFRDLRSHCVTCNAAVYPGVTRYGETFQSAHDATMVKIDRDIQSSEYLENMREIVVKQASASVQTSIQKNGQNFAILAFAASGNPRILLKTLAAAPKLNSSQINEVIREFYRTDMWAEHSLLTEKYFGHKPIIDWGRDFLEKLVLPALKTRNDSALSNNRDTSAFFWIHRDAPELIKEAMRILSYTGLVAETASGMKATRSEVGTRFEVNLGILFSLESIPVQTAFKIVQSLSQRRMMEFGMNHGAYSELLDSVDTVPDTPNSYVLETQLSKPIEILDISDFQYQKLKSLELDTIGDVLRADDATLLKAYYVGVKRSRQMKNAATSAVLEYLSG